MDEQRIARLAPERAQETAHASPKQGQACREDRAREIVRAHAREMAESASGAVYRVPGSGGLSYVVSLSRQTCECADFTHRDLPCKHLLAATIVAAKSATCADCADRFLRRDLYEVGEGHLCFFEDDLLCRRCALSHGVA